MSRVVDNARLCAAKVFMDISDYASDKFDDNVIQLTRPVGNSLWTVNTSVSNTDKVKGHGWTLVSPFHRRSDSDVQKNNDTRAVLMTLLTRMFKVDTPGMLPPGVQEVLKLNDFDGTGHPLSARRIKAITAALKDEAACSPELQTMLAMRQVGDLDGQIKNSGLSAAQRRAALLAQIDNYATIIGNVFVPPGEARQKFDGMVDEYVKTLRAFPDDYEVGREDSSCAKGAFRAFARIALGGRDLPIPEDVAVYPFLKEVLTASGGHTCTMQTILGVQHPNLFARVAPFLNDNLSILCLKNAEAFAALPQDETRPPARADIYRVLTGDNLPDELQNAPNKRFNDRIEKFLETKITARLKERMPTCTDKESLKQNSRMVIATMCGNNGLACDMETAIQLQSAQKGVSLTMSNVQCATPLYNVVLARNRGLSKLTDQLRSDLPRNHAVYHIGERTFDCRGLQGKDVERVLQDFIEALQEMFKDDLDQLLVAGFGFTQAGTVLASACPLNASGKSDHAPMEVTITRDPQTGSASYATRNIPPPDGPRVELSFRYDIRRDGGSVLTDIRYNMPPQNA